MPTLVSKSCQQQQQQQQQKQQQQQQQQATFTLSFQGIEFQLQPGQLGSKFSLHHVNSEQILLELSNFTGQLLVKPSNKVISVDDSVTTTSYEVVESSNISTNLLPPPLSQNQLEVNTTTNIPPSPEPKDIEESVTTTQSKKRNPPSSQTVQHKLEFPSKRSPTSDTDSLSSKKSKRSTPKDNSSKASFIPSKKSIPQSVSCHVTVSPESKPTLATGTTTTMPTTTALTTTTRIISKASSPTPPPRWGHTLTPIQDQNVVLYGGQTIQSETVATTLSDLYVYNCQTQQFSKPIQCDGVERQWHSAAYLPQRQLMIAFGGEAPDEKGKMKTLNQVMVLDTEIMLWYPPTVTGEIPTGRSGHTATVLSSNHLMVVIGGVRANSYQRGVCLLDTNRWTWLSPPQIQGDAPRPRSYHTATLVPRPKSSQKEWIVVFGGNDRDTSFNSVHILEVDTAANQWSWIHPLVSGDIPVPRTGHVAVLTDDQTTIVIQGGWDPNSDDDDDVEEESLLDDCYSLDTTTWIWTKLESTSSNTSCARVGHRTVYHDDQIHVFGGRLNGHKFSNSWATLKEWNPNSKS